MINGLLAFQGSREESPDISSHIEQSMNDLCSPERKAKMKAGRQNMEIK
jgi:hypothetical protein